MYRLHVARNLRSLAFLLVVSAVVAACGLLWWANSTGMPEPWRAMIEHDLGAVEGHSDQIFDPARIDIRQG